MRRALTSWLTGLCLLVALPGFAEEPEAVSPIPRAHAHNDYEHQRPLFDALAQGFCSVEADIFLIRGELLVGHTALDLKPERTLQKLYLDPLRERARTQGGRIYKKMAPFYLLIDVKTEAKPTYTALAKVLSDYADLLTETSAGKTVERAVTVVVSGNCDREAISSQAVRHASIDGRPHDLAGKEPASLVPWVSASWASQFKWNGTGSMDEGERKKMRDYVAKAHEQKRLVRFWGTPDKPEAWAEQLSAGVDLINTDKLAELRRFLLEQSRGKP